MKRKKRVRRRKITSIRASAGGKRECSTGDRQHSGDDSDLRGLGGARWVRGREREELHSRLAEFRKLHRRVPKKRISLNLDADVLAFFKDQGPRYQGLINQALHEVMEEEKEKQAEH